MTRFTFPAGYDEYGFATAAGRRSPCPAAATRESPTAPPPTSPTWPPTRPPTYARRDDDGHYLVDRVCRTHQLRDRQRRHARPWSQLRDAVLAGPPADGSRVSLRVIGHTRTFYDGEAFTGLPLGQLGEHGLPVRTETLAFTDDFLDSLYDPADPLAVGPRPGYLTPGAASWTGEYPPEFRDQAARAGRIRALRRRRGSRLAGRVLHRPPPGTATTSTTPARGAARAAAVVTRPARRPRPGPTTTSTTCCRSARPTRPGWRPARSNDYRVLQPRELTDPNGNTTAVTFSPVGPGHRPVRARQGRRRRPRPARAPAWPTTCSPSPSAASRLGHHDPAGAPRHRRPTSRPTSATR